MKDLHIAPAGSLALSNMVSEDHRIQEGYDIVLDLCTVRPARLVANGRRMATYLGQLDYDREGLPDDAEIARLANP